MPNTDESVTTAAPTTTGEGSGNGNTSRDAAGGAPAGATTEPSLTSDHTVYQRIAWVIANLPAIPKDQEGPPDQGRYKYRGIESIQAAAQKLMARAGVVYAPRSKILEVVARPENAKPGWQDYRVEYTWTVRGTGRGDRFRPAPVTIGVGRDNSDKGVNKAQSQALKYMLNALLQIADPVADGDAHGDYGAQMSPDEAEAQAQRDANPVIDRDTFDTLAARIKALPDDAKAQLVAAWTREDPDGQPYLPTVDGSPRIGSLRRNDVLAAEALILAAEKAAGGAPAPAQAGESVADRAARMARERAAKPAEGQEAASDDAQEHEGDAGDGGTPETADGPTAPVPEGTEVAILNDAGEPVDLATENSNQIAARLAPLRATVPQDFVAAMVESVRKLHHARVDAEIRGVPGQTVAEDEHIDHRRMRVSLVRLLVQAQRQEAQTDA